MSRPSYALYVLAVTSAAGLGARQAAAGGDAAGGRAVSPVSPTKILAAVHQGGGGQIYMQGGPGDRVDRDADRTLAPFFHVAGGDPDTDRLPLKETTADVQIAGVIARVRVHQVFENGGRKPIEAEYVFPASTRAAVHGMRMKIGQRTVEAKIDRKADAREAYEAARAQGKRTSLLEQQRPNVFTMNVANVMPGDRIEVELDYSELLVPTDAVYEFVYPTVVGPRYGGGADPVKDRWIASPYTGEGGKEPYRFDIGVHLETGIALKDLSSPSHKLKVAWQGRTSADVRLDEAPTNNAGNRDYVLRYRLAGDRIETGLLLGEAGGEKFFTLMMEPPQRPTDAQIPPREYIFLLDVSGSMHGFPLDTAKTLMKSLLSQLRPSDWFDVALFSGANYVMSREGSVPATRGNIELATDLIERQQGGGGTELMGGLEASYAIPRRGEGVSRSVVVVTDGYVGVEAQAFRFIRERLDQANLFAFGIGSSVNRHLIEGMARAGQGEPFVVLKPEKAKAEADKLRAMIERPVLTSIAVRMNGFDAYEVSPGKVPDLMARRPVVVFGKYRGEAKGRIEVSGLGGGGARFASAVDVRASDVRAQNAPLRWLWARKWVSTLDDEMHLGASKEIEEAITGLGLQYTLLTSFTSFVAVDSQIANRSGQVEGVQQPLPMPEGVSNYAVGGGARYKRSASSGSYGHGALGATGTGSGGGGYGRGSGGMGAMGTRAAAAPFAGATKSEAKKKSADSLDDLLSSGTGHASGGVAAQAPAASTPVSPAPPPVNASRPKPAERSRRLAAADEEAEEGASASVPRGHLRFLVQAMKATGLPDDGKALGAAIEGKLAEAARACGAAAGSVKLRLTVDRTGKVTKVEIVSGAPATASCLRDRLSTLASASKPSGDTATFEITIAAIRLDR